MSPTRYCSARITGWYGMWIDDRHIGRTSQMEQSSSLPYHSSKPLRQKSEAPDRAFASVMDRQMVPAHAVITASGSTSSCEARFDHDHGIKYAKQSDRMDGAAVSARPNMRSLLHGPFFRQRYGARYRRSDQARLTRPRTRAERLVRGLINVRTLDRDIKHRQALIGRQGLRANARHTIRLFPENTGQP